MPVVVVLKSEFDMSHNIIENSFSKDDGTVMDEMDEEIMDGMDVMDNWVVMGTSLQTDS
jgi:hypothetical protein